MLVPCRKRLERGLDKRGVRHNDGKGEVNGEGKEDFSRRLLPFLQIDILYRIPNATKALTTSRSTFTNHSS